MTPKPSRTFLLLRTLRPLTAFKNAPNPKFVKKFPRRLFFGVRIRGTQICQKFVENLKDDNFRTNFQIFEKCLTNLGPPDSNPKNNRRGKFLTTSNAVRGQGTHANTQNLPHSRAFPASTSERSPPKCLFFMTNAKLPNRPGFALLPVHTSSERDSNLVLTRF